MRSCRDGVNYLHSLGYSDTEIANKCGVTRVYINMVRNGKKVGSENLQEMLHRLSMHVASSERKIAPSKQSRVETVNYSTPAPVKIHPTQTGTRLAIGVYNEGLKVSSLTEASAFIPVSAPAPVTPERKLTSLDYIIQRGREILEEGKQKRK